MRLIKLPGGLLTALTCVLLLCLCGLFAGVSLDALALGPWFSRVVLASMCVLSLCLRRLHANLPMLQAPMLQFRHATAFTMWWVPPFNLVVPVLFLTELHHMGRIALGRPTSARPAVWAIWWACCGTGVVGTLAGNVSWAPWLAVASLLFLAGMLVAMWRTQRLAMDAVELRPVTPVSSPRLRPARRPHSHVPQHRAGSRFHSAS